MYLLPKLLMLVPQPWKLNSGGVATHQVGHTGGSGVHGQVGDVVVHGPCGYGRVRVRSATTRTARPSPVVARIELVLGMPLWHTWFDEGRQGVAAVR